MQRFRGGLLFKAHRLCVPLNSRLESNEEEEGNLRWTTYSENSPGFSAARMRYYWRTLVRQSHRILRVARKSLASSPFPISYRGTSRVSCERRHPVQILVGQPYLTQCMYQFVLESHLPYKTAKLLSKSVIVTIS